MSSINSLADCAYLALAALGGAYCQHLSTQEGKGKQALYFFAILTVSLGIPALWMLETAPK